jgi:hypothetical protein
VQTSNNYTNEVIEHPGASLEKILFQKSFDQQNLDYVLLNSDSLFETSLLNGNSEHTPRGFSKIPGY